MQKINRQEMKAKKRRNRIRFERLMAHLGYGICVLTIWGAILCGGRILLDIILG